MGTKTVRLDEDVYERIRARKRDDETFSEAIERLTSAYTLVDFADEPSVIDPDRHRDTLEARDERSKRETAARMERLGLAGVGQADGEEAEPPDRDGEE